MLRFAQDDSTPKQFTRLFELFQMDGVVSKQRAHGNSREDTRVQRRDGELKARVELGWRMPAEWEEHHATWLGWPHELTDWPGKFAPIPWAFAEIVRLLTEVERVFLMVESRAAEKKVRGILRKAGAKVGSVEFFVAPTDRGWMRDSGPICVKNAAGQVAYNNFVFNGWAKYSNHKKDAQVVRKANARLKRKVFFTEHNGRRVVLEGGSIEGNGSGTLQTK